MTSPRTAAMTKEQMRVMMAGYRAKAAPPFVEDAVEAAVECRSCVDLRGRIHAFAEEDSRARRSLHWAERDLGEAIARADKAEHLGRDLADALDAVTHVYEHQAAGLCRCGYREPAPIHRTSAVVRRLPGATVHVFAPGMSGASCVFVSFGRACGFPPADSRHIEAAA